MASRQSITDDVIIRKNILQNLTISELFAFSNTDISGIPQDPKLNIFGRFQGALCISRQVLDVNPSRKQLWRLFHPPKMIQYPGNIVEFPVDNPK